MFSITFDFDLRFMMGQAHEIHGLLQGLDTKARVFWGRREQGITNTLGLPIDKMLYIYLLCPHSERREKPIPI
jgi:hypothetical protein